MIACRFIDFYRFLNYSNNLKPKTRGEIFMRLDKALVIILFVILLALTATSQHPPIISTEKNTKQITPTISLDEDKICTTSFFSDVQDVYSNCVYYHNYTSCLKRKLCRFYLHQGLLL